MKRSTVGGGGWLLVGWLVVAGSCEPPSVPEDLAARDLEIRTDVKSLLNAEGDAFLDVFPECREGVVTLKGRVASAEGAARAVEIAREAAGVRGVVDALEVPGR